MARGRKSKWLKYLGFISILVAVTLLFWAQQPDQEEVRQLRVMRNLEMRVQIARALEAPLKHLEFPDRIDVKIDDQVKAVTPRYTFENNLQKEAERLLKQYKPDYGAIFMMDAKTGRVLVFTSFQRGAADPVNLVTRASSPAASVFKIVTATAAIDRAGMTPATRIHFNGGNYTLYKKNVLSDRINRWTRTVTLRDAFARSLNTAFGRLSLEKLRPEDVNEYAARFMFNQEMVTDFPVEKGIAVVPTEKGFEFTEVASGYNKINRMSPVQGAMIAATVINDGRMVMPYMVDELKDANGQTVYKAEAVDSGQIMSTVSAEQIRELMEETILSGTSRKTFRSLVKNRNFREISMGGKTGHLTGDNPRGRVDWFVGYASDEDKRIAIAALTVNKEFWTVKSSHLGQTLFKSYFGPVIKSRDTASEARR